MSLQKKIQKIIDVLNNSNIEEIEVSSFWGAQKIRLSKSKTNQQTPVIIKDPAPKTEVPTAVVDSDNISAQTTPLEDNSTNQEENIEPGTIVDTDVIEKTQLPDEDLEYQKAPLVGTFYLSSKAGEPPFISVGDTVSKGQTLCIIEAMKIFNEIESDFEGEIVEVLVDDESPVEFNQKIFSIKPN